MELTRRDKIISEKLDQCDVYSGTILNWKWTGHGDGEWMDEILKIYGGKSHAVYERFQNLRNNKW